MASHKRQQEGVHPAGEPEREVTIDDVLTYLQDKVIEFEGEVLEPKFFYALKCIQETDNRIPAITEIAETISFLTSRVETFSKHVGAGSGGETIPTRLQHAQNELTRATKLLNFLNPPENPTP